MRARWGWVIAAAVGCTTPSTVYVRDASSSDSGAVVDTSVMDVVDGGDTAVTIDTADAGDAPDAPDVVSMDASDVHETGASDAGDDIPDVADAPDAGNFVDVSDVPVVVDVLDVTDAPDVLDVGVDVVCGTAQTLCSRACVDTASLQFDATNCGVCDNRCSAGNVCVGGRCSPPRLNALHVPLADNTTETLTIEGAFATTGATIVSFPGAGGAAITTTATVLGPSRLSTTVPSGAVAGDLTVRTAGSGVTNSLRFRRTGFALGLQHFRSRYEQVEYARQTPTLVTARVNPAWINTGTWLYVMGGADRSGNALDSVERSLINADGTLSYFDTAPSSLGSRREGAAAVRVGDRVYVLGGQRAGEAVATVESASVGTDGQLSAFSSSSLTLRTARSGHVAEIIGGYLYVFGGATNTVERAPIDGSGALGAFETLTGVTTRTRRQRAMVQVVGGYVYLIGGTDGTSTLDTIERASIRAATDSLGDFEAMITRLSTPREGAASVVLGARLYVAGGANGSTASASIESAEITPSSNLNAFAPVAGRSLSTVRHGAVSTVVGNYWYLIGGANVEPLADLDRSQIIGSVTLGAGTVVTGVNHTTARYYHRLVPIGQNVYAIGGASTSSMFGLVPLERAAVAPDLTLDPFAVIPMAPQDEGNGGAVAVIRNYAYFFRGGGTTVINRAVFSREGVFQLFQPAGVSLSVARNGAGVVVIGSNLYVIGGAAPGGDQNSVDRFVIDPSGQLLSPPTTMPSMLPGPRYNFVSALLANSLWAVSGWSNGPIDSISQSMLGADETPGTFMDASSPRLSAHGAGGAIIGAQLHVVGGVPSRSIADALPTVSSATIGSDGALGSFSTTAALNTARQTPACLVVGDSLYVSGGTDRTGAQLATIERLPLR